MANACIESVQVTLDEVVIEVEQMEREGSATPDARSLGVDDTEDASDEGGDSGLERRFQRRHR